MRVRVHPQKLECPFESEADLLEEVDDQGGATIGTISGVGLSSEEPLRSAETERRRGDYWRFKAMVYRLALWQVETGMPRLRQQITTKLRTQRLRVAVDALKSSGGYKNPNAAATWLIDNTEEERDKRGRRTGKVWGYDIDDEDPKTRERAIARLAERIRTLEKK